MSFEKELDFLKKNKNQDKLVNNKIKSTVFEINSLKENYPKLPEDFFDYLLEVGAGNLMESQFKVMDDLFDFNDLGLEDIMIYQIILSCLEIIIQVILQGLMY